MFIPLFMNNPKANNFIARIMILTEMVPFGIDFLRMLLQEIKIEDPMMKINQGKTKSATVNPRNGKDIRIVDPPIIFERRK